MTEAFFESRQIIQKGKDCQSLNPSE